MLPERWANDAQKKCYFANFQTFLLNSRPNQMFATLLNIQELSQIGEPNFQKLEIQFRCQCVYSFILPIFLIVRSPKCAQGYFSASSC